MRLTKRGTEIITQRGQGQRITVATNQPGKQPKRARAGRRRREITPTQACGCFHGGFTTQFRFFWCAINRHMCNWVRSSSFSTTKAGTPATATSAAASGRGGNNTIAKTGAVAAATAATAAALALAAAVEEFAATPRARVATSTATAVARWTGETCPG